MVRDRHRDGGLGHLFDKLGPFQELRIRPQRGIRLVDHSPGCVEVARQPLRANAAGVARKLLVRHFLHECGQLGVNFINLAETLKQIVCPVLGVRCEQVVECSAELEKAIVKLGHQFPELITGGIHKRRAAARHLRARTVEPGGQQRCDVELDVTDVTWHLTRFLHFAGGLFLFKSLQPTAESFIVTCPQRRKVDRSQLRRIDRLHRVAEVHLQPARLGLQRVNWIGKSQAYPDKAAVGERQPRPARDHRRATRRGGNVQRLAARHRHGHKRGIRRAGKLQHTGGVQIKTSLAVQRSIADRERGGQLRQPQITAEGAAGQPREPVVADGAKHPVDFQVSGQEAVSRDCRRVRAALLFGGQPLALGERMNGRQHLGSDDKITFPGLPQRSGLRGIG